MKEKQSIKSSKSSPSMSKDYPLLTVEEDAADFQLAADPLPDDTKIKARKRKEADERSKRETPNLF